MSDITTTLAGNLVEKPELRVTTSGQPVANLRIAQTERRYDRRTGTWADGTTTYFRGTLWGTNAENAAESLHKGDRVLLTGRLRQRDYTTKDGEKRSTYELDIDEIGASLRYATASLTKASRSGSADDEPHNRPPF